MALIKHPTDHRNQADHRISQVVFFPKPIFYLTLYEITHEKIAGLNYGEQHYISNLPKVPFVRYNSVVYDISIPFPYSFPEHPLHEEMLE